MRLRTIDENCNVLVETLVPQSQGRGSYRVQATFSLDDTRTHVRSILAVLCGCTIRASRRCKHIACLLIALLVLPDDAAGVKTAPVLPACKSVDIDKPLLLADAMTTRVTLDQLSGDAPPSKRRRISLPDSRKKTLADARKRLLRKVNVDPTRAAAFAAEFSDIFQIVT